MEESSDLKKVEVKGDTKYSDKNQKKGRREGDTDYKHVRFIHKLIKLHALQNRHLLASIHQSNTDFLGSLLKSFAIDSKKVVANSKDHLKCQSLSQDLESNLMNISQSMHEPS